MAISGVSSATHSQQVAAQNVNSKQAKMSRDVDGDTDGPKAGQADKAAAAVKVTVAKTTASTIGSGIDVKA